jgi:hypothetical protein
MLTESETTVSVATVEFSCQECKEQSAGQVLLWERSQRWFLIPMGTERQVLLRCERCGAEHMTKDVGAEQLVGLSPEAISTYVTKIKSSPFAKVMIILWGMAWFLPLLGPIIYVRLRHRWQHIRGGWRRAYRVLLFLTILAHAGWVPYIVYTLMKEGF